MEVHRFLIQSGDNPAGTDRDCQVHKMGGSGSRGEFPFKFKLGGIHVGLECLPSGIISGRILGDPDSKNIIDKRL